MLDIELALDRVNWTAIGSALDDEGFAVMPSLLSDAQAVQLAASSAEAHALAAALRAGCYPRLADVANRWNSLLGLAHRFACAGGHGAARTTRLRAGEYEALHQQVEGEHVFPLQLVALLSEPGADFTGGEFVMTEQRPRMQSRPIVVPMRKLNVAIIATARRPQRGTQGHYRVNLKHAVSRVRSGERVGWELLLDDARR